MNTETITEAAHREAERLHIEPSGEATGPEAAIAFARAVGFTEGAAFGAAWERDREPTDPEVGAAADELRAEGARAALTELAVWLRVPGVSGPLVTEKDVIAFARYQYPEETDR